MWLARCVARGVPPTRDSPAQLGSTIRDPESLPGNARRKMKMKRKRKRKKRKTVLYTDNPLDPDALRFLKETGHVDCHQLLPWLDSSFCWLHGYIVGSS